MILLRLLKRGCSMFPFLLVVLSFIMVLWFLAVQSNDYYSDDEKKP